MQDQEDNQQIDQDLALSSAAARTHLFLRVSTFKSGDNDTS